MIKILNEHITIVLFALLMLLLLCYALPNIYKYINSAISKYKESKKPPAEIPLIEPSLAQQASLYDHGAAGIKIKLKNPMMLANAKMGKQDSNPYEWEELETEDICREKYTDYVDENGELHESNSMLKDCEDVREYSGHNIVQQILDDKVRRMEMNKLKIIAIKNENKYGYKKQNYKTFEFESKKPIKIEKFVRNTDEEIFNVRFENEVGVVHFCSIPYDEIVSIEIGDIKINNVNKDEKEN